jgi:RNA polymerase sigma factor (sigma-70 family)
LSRCYPDNTTGFTARRGLSRVYPSVIKKRNKTLKNTATYSDDKDLERLFAEARKYTLLTATQETEIDGKKWAAVRELEELMIQDQASRDFLQRWCEHCTNTPPELGDTINRELHFILRREITAYMAGGKLNPEVQALQVSLSSGYDFDEQLSLLRSVNLPASLAVGLTISLLRNSELDIPCNVSDALEQWQKQWSDSHKSSSPVAARRRRAMVAVLEQYNDARDTLTLHNLRLVYTIAGRFRRKGINFLDMVQEGTLGLMRAAEKFDHRKGYRFSTYCYNWITQPIRQYVSDNAGLIRYPTEVHERVGKIYWARLAAVSRSGKEPGDAELAKATGLSLEKTRALKQLRNLGISLDQPIYDDSEESMVDTMPGEAFARTPEVAESASLRRCLLDEMASLEPAEREVVIARWGLHEGPPLSRAEIADRMAVSGEWVRQLESSALKKLKGSDTIKNTYQDYGGAPSW